MPIATAGTEIPNQISSSSSSASTGPAAPDSETQAAVPDSELRLVSFTVSSQEYGIPIEDVQEIVQLPEDVTALPQAPAHVRGVISLRQRLLPLVDLRSLFHLGAPEGDTHQRIVVVSLPGCGPVGLVTDAVKEVLSVPRQHSDAVPELLTRDRQLAEFDAICRLDEGRRLVSVLSSARLLGLEAVRAATALTRGLQTRVMATVKHFALNSMENARFTVDVTCAEEHLHEVYLPHFLRIVDEGVACVMSAYNSVNGDYCGENRVLLTEILRFNREARRLLLDGAEWGRKPRPTIGRGNVDVNRAARLAERHGEEPS